jgi:hypothetical protein
MKYDPDLGDVASFCEQDLWEPVQTYDRPADNYVRLASYVYTRSDHGDL